MSIRKAAVEGRFYPSSPAQLREDIEGYLSAARSLQGANANTFPAVNVLIAPHAGYVFSGAVAARGYACVSKNIKTVIIIGPSHYQRFNGLYISDVDYFETPLGKVKLNKDIVSQLKSNPVCRDIFGVDEKEHCLEVQLPFLQVLLNEFTIVPVLTGVVDPAAAAGMLLPFMGDTVLVIASSDLSHFFNQDKARRVDDESISTITAGDVDGPIDGCGEDAIRVVMNLAERMGLSPQLLDARTSYETAPRYGDPDRVVGYASIIYVNKKDAG
ncbi:MAG: AmmeMemoRadiSam system protein B [Chitinispirillia bacterium]|nr:AmmeMemoRadiSam system protein B [Chitinispirillia bacterium]